MTASPALRSQLPLPLNWDGLNLSATTGMPIYVLVQDPATHVVSVGICAVSLTPPVSAAVAGNATSLSSAIAAIAAGITPANASSSPLAVLLEAATLSSMLGTLSTGQLVAGSAVPAGNVSAGVNGSTAGVVVRPNSATRAALLDLTAAALASLLAPPQGSSGTAVVLDDTTLGTVALAIRTLSLDPFELDVGSAGSAVSALTTLMQVRGAVLTGREGPRSDMCVIP